jgi:hypothetical protein
MLVPDQLREAGMTSIEKTRSETNEVGGPAPRVVLASRQSARMRVTLLWAAETDTVAVLVRDEGLGDQFVLAVEPCVSPLDVYEHPYAYAAWRGVDYRTDDSKVAATGCSR